MAVLALPLEGERLRLRSLGLDDATDRYVAWMNDPEVNAHLESRFGVHDRASLEAFIAGTNESPSTWLFGIVERDGDRHVGNIKVGPIDAAHGRGDIGLLLGERDCWGRGYAREAITLLSDWAFQELGVRKLTAGAYGSNPGSVKAFHAAGFTTEGIRPRHYVDADGVEVDLVQLARFAPVRVSQPTSA
jgi:RimJ/RimL family protein N-acetyltransferase